MSHPRRTAVRILSGLLLAAALVGGVWWNSIRLNETERKLVGVWESDAGGKTRLLLSDRRQFEFMKLRSKDHEGGVNEFWIYASTVSRWEASPDSILFRNPPSAPLRGSVAEWLAFAKALWNGDSSQSYQIARVDDDQLSLHGDAEYRRSMDPKLLRIFDRLSSGESP